MPFHKEFQQHRGNKIINSPPCPAPLSREEIQSFSLYLYVCIFSFSFWESEDPTTILNMLFHLMYRWPLVFGYIRETCDIAPKGLL